MIALCLLAPNFLYRNSVHVYWGRGINPSWYKEVKKQLEWKSEACQHDPSVVGTPTALNLRGVVGWTELLWCFFSFSLSTSYLQYMKHILMNMLPFSATRLCRRFWEVTEENITAVTDSVQGSLSCRHSQLVACRTFLCPKLDWHGLSKQER